MRYLGIDYGTKRIGLALSDESGKIAFPHSIINNTQNAINEIAKLCGEKKVTGIVLGESLNNKREANPVMSEINLFKTKLTETTKLEIILEPEWFTSALAARSAEKDENVDDAAAALILQTYLDKRDRL
jgi:putative Holliday junction resolvase